MWCNACVHRLDLGIHSHPKRFWENGVRTYVNSKGITPSTGKILPSRGSNPRHCIKQDSEPNTLRTSYFSPIVSCNVDRLLCPHRVKIFVWKFVWRNTYICQTALKKKDWLSMLTLQEMQEYGLGMSHCRKTEETCEHPQHVRSLAQSGLPESSSASKPNIMT